MLKRLLSAAAVASLVAAALPVAAAAAEPVPISNPYVFTADDVGLIDGGDRAGAVGRIPEMDAYLGAKKPILRLDLFWNDVQPVEGGPMDWTVNRLDEQVDAAYEQGIRVLLILDYSAAWANAAGRTEHLPSDNAAWERIVAATVDHFGPKVQAYEVWNEPNITTFGNHGDNSPAVRAGRYWDLVEIASKAVKARCAACLVLAGGSAGGDVDATATPIRNDNEPADWLEIAYRNNKGAFFDAVTVHPYPDMGGGHLPSYARTSCANGVWYRFWSGFGPDGDVDCGGLAALHDVMVRNGDGHKKIWATEFGFSMLGPREPLAARYVRDALEEGVRSWRMRPYAGPLFVYSFQQPSPAHPICAERPGECHFGLRDAAGNPKEPMYSDVGAALRGDSWPSALVSGRSLFRGSALRSGNGRYTLWMQGDGNLVLYEVTAAGNRVLWARGGQKAYRLTGQDDGDLVLYDHTRDHTVKPGDTFANPAIWASGTAGKGASTLRLQNDGNLVLYRDSDNTAVWDTATYTVSLISALNGKCLDVPSATFASGARPQMYPCNGTSAQQWIHSDERVLTKNNLCLDVKGGATANGAVVQLWTCNGGAAQRFQFTSAGSLLNPKSGRCVDIPGGNVADNVLPQIRDCDGSAAQRWRKAGV
ncbi:RICIN domain-containing protein [Actinoplanes sp. NEAU-A12]|uniref:RICIN domain-containing protein n=1 Tax=Actinoplanes sandaracinus TaxID=3045177 RepID=A0ABT6WBN7_9ACTN|nr:ricin-type beta-trefoil lectin domain protein [Actinoplanes sandaracinus]MDI6097112.1 RICIN domain-containing protein [Actinoplanes sandaracinus]